jgi:tellurite resistance protein TerC
MLMISDISAACLSALASDVQLGFPADTIAIFASIFAVSLCLDLFQHRKHQEVTVANAAAWSLFWVAMALGFAGWLHHRHGHEASSLFLAGYVLEKTLSVDNLMVFIAIFEYFKIKSALQHRILYYGILGAIVFRLIFVVLGSGLLLAVGPWAEIVFGALVAWAGYQMLAGGGDEGESSETPDYQNMFLVRCFQRIYPVFDRLVGHQFFLRRKQAEQLAAQDASIKLKPGVVRWMTPAFVCLLVIEGSDVLFAFDSVPAVIAVTRDPVLVFSAMIFAILGLRSLYFILLALNKYLVHLEKAVVVVLFFIAAKMFLSAFEHLLHWTPPFEITPVISLVVVLSILSLGVLASFIWPSRDEAVAGES